MDFAIKILQIIFYSIGSTFMITFTIIGIWSFILYIRNSKNLRLQNYILEKIFQSINIKNNTILNSSEQTFKNDLMNLSESHEN